MPLAKPDRIIHRAAIRFSYKQFICIVWTQDVIKFWIIFNKASQRRFVTVDSSNFKKMQALLLCCLVTYASSAFFNDPPPVIYAGQINIGVLADLRDPGNGSLSCGILRPAAVQQVMAAIWATHQVNRRKEPEEFNLGLYIYDACGRTDVAQRQTFRLIEQIAQLPRSGCGDERMPPLMGVVALGEPETTMLPAHQFKSFDLPVVMTSALAPSELHLKGVFSTAPSSKALARALISILRRLSWNSFVLCTSDREQRKRAEQFLSMAEKTGLAIVTAKNKDRTCRSAVEIMSKGDKTSSTAAILFLGVANAIQLLSEKTDGDKKHQPIIIVTPNDITENLQSHLSPPQIAQMKTVVFLSPADTKIPEYHAFYVEALRGAKMSSNPLLSQLPGLDNLTNPETAVPEIDVSSTVKAVWGLSSAIKEVQKRTCRIGRSDCLIRLRRTLRSEVGKAMHETQFVFRQSGIHGLEGNRLIFDDDGFLASSRYLVKTSSSKGEIQEVAWYSDEAGLMVNEMMLLANDALRPHSPSTLRFEVDNQPPPSRLRSSSFSMTNVAANPSQKPDHGQRKENVIEEKSATVEIRKITTVDELPESWFSKPWGLVVLSICGTGLLLTMYVFVFLMIKVCEGCVRRVNHTLAFFLLLAVFLMFVGAVLFLFNPSEFFCALQRVVHNVAFAFTFACLLQKAMSLRAVGALGLGGRESRLNIMISLMFTVGLQVAVEVQWWILKPIGMPSLETIHLLKCDIDQKEFLISQSYIAVLLFMAMVMSFSSRSAPYGHREGQNVFVTCCCCIPAFAAWTSSYGLVRDAESRAIVASLGMVVTAYAVLGGIYGPMLYAIHKFGGIPHKKLSYSDSLSSVFSMFRDLERPPAPIRGKKGAKTLEYACTEIVRNPLFQNNSSSVAYP